MTKEQEIMAFLHRTVFDPILDSSRASAKLKQGVRYTISGTERSVGFAARMRAEGFTRLRR
jgi:hypothetical protein